MIIFHQGLIKFSRKYSTKQYFGAFKNKKNFWISTEDCGSLLRRPDSLSYKNEAKDCLSVPYQGAAIL